MTGEVKNYKSIPALAAYIDRIGAEQLNFRRFMIKEHKGHYYTEKAIIKIERDGTIHSNKKEYAPTKEEAEQIKGALMSAEWPKAILASNINSLLKLTKANKEDLFVFRSRKEKGIIMVQQRCTFKNGDKAYLPWTLFSDNEWRRMEPDGPLPFWKPEKTDETARTKIMIHEGAKAAAHVDWMINSKDKEARELKATHPWADELDEYEHWGMIGGALAPHRADYSELWHEKPVEVVYICDNDWPGKAALKDVSKHWGGTLKGVLFDTNWPASFDLGDEFVSKTCPKLFDNGRYNGPSLTSKLLPATWATELMHNDNNKSVFVVRRVFREEWWHAVEPEVFIHIDQPNRLLGPMQFNNTVAPYSDVDDTARLLRKDHVGKAAILSYEPGHRPGLYGSKEKGYYINTHVPSHIRKEKGDFAPWLHFMNFLFEDDNDRLEALRWCATLIGRPDIKMHYGMLLVSETQGVGKTTLAEKILQPLIGYENTSVPSEKEMTESQFNAWIAHKRLAIVSEIYAGHSSKAYDTLKAVITDRTISVNKKYTTSYTIENWCHIVASSNSMRALKISAEDRRWFVPKVTEYKQKWDYWEKFNHWLRYEGGLEKIKYWAEDVFLKENDPVKTGDAAPWSSIKQEMIDEGLSPGLQYVSNVLQMVKEEMNGANFYFPDVDMIELIKDKFYDGKNADKLERPLTVRKLAKNLGLFASKKRYAISEWGTRETNPKLICSNANLVDMSHEELQALAGGPLNLKDFLNKKGGI